MIHMSIVETRDRLADAVNRVNYAGERVVLQRRGKGVAALVSMEDLAALEEMENRIDLEEARKVLAHMKATGEKSIPWEQVERELDQSKASRRGGRRKAGR